MGGFSVKRFLSVLLMVGVSLFVINSIPQLRQLTRNG